MKKNLKTYDSSEFTNQIFEEEDEIDLLQIFHDIKVAIVKNKKTAIFKRKKLSIKNVKRVIFRLAIRP